MPIVKINIKHNQNTYNDIEIDTDESVAVLKAQFWALTNVPPERQKVMIKGLLKDDTDLNKLNLKAGQKVMLMGTPEEDITPTSDGKTPTQEPEKLGQVLLEDLSFDLQNTEQTNNDEEDTTAEHFTGIANLGNTCFVNSVLQFLRPNLELSEAIISSKPVNLDLTSKDMFLVLKSYYENWGKFGPTIRPLHLLRALSHFFPELFKKESFDPNEKNKLANFLSSISEGYMQQDSEQFLSALLNFLNQHMGSQVISSSFGVKTEVTFESEEESLMNVDSSENSQSASSISPALMNPTEDNKTNVNMNSQSAPSSSSQNVKNETFFILSCPLGGGSQQTAKTTTPASSLEIFNNSTNSQSISKAYSLTESISLFFKNNVTKYSNILKRDALYTKTMKISVLPKFLIIHFVRFEWKNIEATLHQPKKGSQTKICRKIIFPKTLDMYPFCSEKLKNDLEQGRKLDSYRKYKEAHGQEAPIDNEKSQGKSSPTPLKNSSNESLEATVTPDEMKSSPDTSSPISLTDGRYEICSIVTHKGRTADSGHYVAWVKGKKKENWIKYDDDILTVHPWSSLDLAGGRSDYHIAYLCMYKQISMETTQNEIDECNNMSNI